MGNGREKRLKVKQNDVWKNKNVFRHATQVWVRICVCNTCFENRRLSAKTGYKINGEPSPRFSDRIGRWPEGETRARDCRDLWCSGSVEHGCYHPSPPLAPNAPPPSHRPARRSVWTRRRPAGFVGQPPQVRLVGVVERSIILFFSNWRPLLMIYREFRLKLRSRVVTRTTYVILQQERQTIRLRASPRQ